MIKTLKIRLQCRVSKKELVNLALTITVISYLGGDSNFSQAFLFLSLLQIVLFNAYMP